MLPLRWALTGASIASVFALLALVGAISGGCSDDRDHGSTDLDAASGGEALGSGICPEVAPDAFARCLLPEGTTCAFGACGTPIARCERGTWVYGGTPPPRPPCPALFPTAGSACPPCWPADVACTYGACFGPDAAANTTVASCPSGAWELDYFPCAADAGPDAGPDPGPDPGEGGAGPGEDDAGADAEPDAHLPRDSGPDGG